MVLGLQHGLIVKWNCLTEDNQMPRVLRGKCCAPYEPDDPNQVRSVRQLSAFTRRASARQSMLDCTHLRCRVAQCVA